MKKSISLKRKVALRIKQIREQNSVSQDTFYVDTNIHIGRIESGEMNLTIETLHKICNYFDISLTEFFKEI